MGKQIVSYVLFFNKNSQNRPDKKKINDIIKYSSGNGISPAERKLLLFASSMSICRKVTNPKLIHYYRSTEMANNKFYSQYKIPQSLAGINCVDNLGKHGNINCIILPLVQLTHT